MSERENAIAVVLGCLACATFIPMELSDREHDSAYEILDFAGKATIKSAIFLIKKYDIQEYELRAIMESFGEEARKAMTFHMVYDNIETFYRIMVY